MKQIDAFILAGEGETQKHYNPLLEKAGVSNKALIKLGGKPMICYILDALNDSKHIKSITIIGLKEKDINYKYNKPIEFIEGGKNSFYSIMAAVEHFAKNGDTSKYVFSLSCDTPLVTAEMIDRYISSIDFNQDIDYYYPLVKVDALHELYPNVTKVAIRFREGLFYGGDLHIFRIKLLLERREVLQDILMNRKHLLKVIRVVSLRVAFMFLIKRLSFNIIQKRMNKLFGLKGAIAIFDYPESCADLDYIEDLDEFDRLCSLPPRKLKDDEQIEFTSNYFSQVHS